MALEDELKEVQIDVRILGKDDYVAGLIFKRKKYRVAFEITDENIETEEKIDEIYVPFSEFCKLEVGDKYKLRLYSFEGAERLYYNRVAALMARMAMED